MKETIETYLDISGVSKIARRYFVMNSFDGVLTVMGLIIGAYIAGIREPETILSTGIAASIALSISGASSAYMTEQAERAMELKHLGSAMLVDLNDTKHEQASKFASIYTAAVNGATPLIVGSIVLLPFFISTFILPIDEIFRIGAFESSLVISYVTLISLSIYLAKISGENVWKYGLRMLFIITLTVAACIGITMLFVY
ncbi:MAG: hypothetical protein BME93_00095 [Methanosarcinales archaeon Met12]|nr:MAG: hypothetical protein BME93_00095 [Methanosarcinales archaeon Met12]